MWCVVLTLLEPLSSVLGDKLPLFPSHLSSELDFGSKRVKCCTVRATWRLGKSVQRYEQHHRHVMRVVQLFYQGRQRQSKRQCRRRFPKKVASSSTVAAAAAAAAANSTSNSSRTEQNRTEKQRSSSSSSSSSSSRSFAFRHCAAAVCSLLYIVHARHRPGVKHA